MGGREWWVCGSITKKKKTMVMNGGSNGSTQYEWAVDTVTDEAEETVECLNRGRSFWLHHALMQPLAFAAALRQK